MPTVCLYMLCLLSLLTFFVQYYAIGCMLKILLAHLEYGETQFQSSV